MTLLLPTNNNYRREVILLAVAGILYSSFWHRCYPKVSGNEKTILCGGRHSNNVIWVDSSLFPISICTPLVAVYGDSRNVCSLENVWSIWKASALLWNILLKYLLVMNTTEVRITWILIHMSSRLRWFADQDQLGMSIYMSSPYNLRSLTVWWPLVFEFSV